MLKLDSNFELAYTGIGKSYLAAGDNKEAMRCFKIGNNKQYYSIAWKRYRNEILKDHLNAILTLVIVLAVLLVVWKKVLKKKVLQIRRERRMSNV